MEPMDSDWETISGLSLVLAKNFIRALSVGVRESGHAAIIVMEPAENWDADELALALAFFL